MGKVLFSLFSKLASKMLLKTWQEGTSVCGLYIKHMVMIFTVILTVMRNPLPITACFIKSETLGSEKDKSHPASGHVLFVSKCKPV